MASDAQVGESAARRYAVLRPYLDERQRRLALAAEAAELGRGGITVVAQATGVHPDTVAKGVRELHGGAEPSGRVRKPGGGRKPATETDPGVGAGVDGAGGSGDARGSGVTAGVDDEVDAQPG